MAKRIAALHLPHRPLMTKKDFLSFQTPFVASEPSVTPEDSVTRYEQCYPVFGAGRGNGANRFWSSESLRHFAVTSHLTERYRLKALPNRPLKRGSSEIQG
jgi:hypothetical protein